KFILLVRSHRPDRRILDFLHTVWQHKRNWIRTRINEVATLIIHFPLVQFWQIEMTNSLHFLFGDLLNLGNICNHSGNVLTSEIVNLCTVTFEMLVRIYRIIFYWLDLRMSNSMSIAI